MNLDAFLYTLPIMGFGMLGIFFIIGIIYCVVALLGKISNHKA